MGIGETGNNLLPLDLRKQGIEEQDKRFHNNVNSKTLKSIEEIATAVAIAHNLVRIGGGEVIPT
jgi:hypothetical protein